jgi:uncharacterized protein (TIGR00730 family)
MTRTVALFGSARPKDTSPLYWETFKAAEHLAENGWTIATGGGPGLMEAANAGAKRVCEGGVCSLGYSIFLPFESSTNDSVQLDSHHDNFFTRLQQFTDDCDAFIALPGGYGTLLEVLTVVQLLQVEHMKPKPLILVGSMWDNIMRYSSNLMWRNRFIGEDEQSFWWVARDPMEAATRLVAYQPLL